MAKVAIVTGSNKGIGFAIVKGLAKAFSGDVYLTSRSEERGLAALKVLETEGINVKFHQLDIGDMASIIKMTNFIKDTYGGIDILVNNAGIAFKQAATEPFAHQAKVTIQTNYFDNKMACEHFLPLLRSGARVVNVSSIAGYLPLIPGPHLREEFAKSDSTLTVKELDNLMQDFIDSAQAGNHADKGWPNSTYVVSKVGWSALTRIQQREMDKDNTRTDIAINHVHPGYVATDMTSHKGSLTIEQGATAPLFAALLPAGTEIRGKYLWADCAL